MAECYTIQEPKNSSQCQYEVLPKHPGDLEITQEQTTKSNKYLPNGKVRLMVDDSGLVSHTAVDLQPDSGGLLPENVSRNNCQCDCSQNSAETHHDCTAKTNKTLDCQLMQLASQIESHDFENNAENETAETVESIHNLERDILNGIEYVIYKSEVQMPDIMRLITKDLSEPYSVYTYRYFIHNWPKLCFLVSIFCSVHDDPG